MSKPLKAWLVIMSVLIIAYGGFNIYRHYRRDSEATTDADETALVRPPRPVEDFEFTERSGRQVRLESLRGKVWAASFFYASCPSTCLKMNQQIAKLHEELGPLGVKFVSVTVDPKNDTPQRLQSYVSKLGIEGDPSTWMFLTGDFQDISDLGMGVFQVTVETQAHSERIILVDRESKVVGTYKVMEPIEAEAFKKKVRQLVGDVKTPAEISPAVTTPEEKDQSATP